MTRVLAIILLSGLWGCVSPSTPGPVSPVDTAVSPDTAPDTADTTPAVDTTLAVDTAVAVDTALPPSPDTTEPPPADTAAPTWPAGAALTAKDIAEDVLTLTWPHAVDDTVVASYVVMRTGLDEATLAGGKSALQVSGLDEATTYTFSVMAEDASGNRSSPLMLTVQTGDVTAPIWDEDATLTASQVTDTTLTLSWAGATDNVAVMAYEVHAGDTVVATTTGATSVDLTALPPWTPLSFEVIAIDGVGNASAPGPKVSVKTSDTVPPTWPGGAALTTSGVSATGVTLTWPAATDNVGIASYQLRQDKVVVATTESGTTTATVTGLDPASNHTFTVWAVDVAGNVSTGNPSATLSTQDGGAPTWPNGASIIASKVMPNTLTLGWTPASDDVAVTAYRVLQNGVEVAVVAETTADITGLGSWMDYTFTVVAEDGAGNASVPGPSVSVKTPDSTSPVWPEGAVLSVSAVGPHGLTLSWAGAMDNVSVVAYRVVQDDVLLATLGAEVTTFDVAGLNPWTNYTFRVGADDLAGNVSEVDLEATVKTPDEVAPTWDAGELLATNVTPNTLTLTWPAASDDVGVTQYRVTLDGEELATVGGEVTGLQVVDLSPWIEYAFAVMASDAAGNWSVDELSLSVKTTDTVKPTWPADGKLIASKLAGTTLTLSWPAASDDVGIASYRVRADGEQVAQVAGDVTEANLMSLLSFHYYLMEVSAIDYAGNASTDLKLSVKTLDTAPPTWPADAVLTASVGVTDLYLSWPAAADNEGVIGYRVFQDGVQIAEGPELTAHVEELKPETKFGFKVEAGDGAGNWSSDGPGATVTTAVDHDPGFRRLTKEQFERTLADTIGPVWEAGWKILDGYNDNYAHPNFHMDAESYYAQIMEYSGWWAWHKAYPADNHTAAPGEPRGGFRRLDQVVFDGHAGSWLSAVMKIADAAVEKWVGRMMILRACALDNAAGVTNFATTTEVYENCISNFITDFGMRAFRRPLSAEEHASFMAAYNEVGEKYPEEGLNGEKQAARGLRNVMATIWLSPEFLYRVELGDENGNLTAWELASRLSYHFWNTMPDDALFAAAKDGSLLTEEGYQAQVERLAGDPKAERAIDEFYRDYFRVQELKNPFIQDGPSKYHGGPAWLKYSNPVSNPVPSMQDELANLGMWFTATNPGTYEDMFRSNLHFLECHYPAWAPEQCSGAGPWSQWSYGIPGCDGKDADGKFPCTGGGWDGVSDPITFPEPERAGLLTRLAFWPTTPTPRGLFAGD